MALVRWRPQRDFFTMRDEMNRMLDRFLSPTLQEEGEMTSPSYWYPQVDISENNNEVKIQAELPGMKKDDIHITFVDGALTLEGERKQDKEEKEKNYHRVERTYGKFSRTFQVPTQIEADKISAEFKDGVLEIRLPKSEKAKPKEIDVKVS